MRELRVHGPLRGAGRFRVRPPDRVGPDRQALERRRRYSCASVTMGWCSGGTFPSAVRRASTACNSGTYLPLGELGASGLGETGGPS